VEATCPLAPFSWITADEDDASTLDIEIVDHLDFDAVDELPFVAGPRTGLTVEDARPGAPTADDRPAGENDGLAGEDHDDRATEASAGDGTSDPPRPTDPFLSLVDVMVDVMLARGASPDAAHFLRALVGLERMEDRSAGDMACGALIAARLVAPGGRGLVRTPAFASQVLAWRQILSGESDDFAVCSAMALDEWAASLVASTLGDPSQTAGVRRDLRSRGVAAFGIVSNAA